MLILRIALGITAMFRGALYLSDPADPAFSNLIFGFLLIIEVAFLLLGFLTPFIAVLGLAGGLLSLAATRTDLAVDIYAIVLSVSIILLGPGAFSLDAQLFGRRKIVIPKNLSGE